jgi:hypothetical protein
MRRNSGKALAGCGQSNAEIDDQHRARKIASKHPINWPEILPLTSTPKSHHEKIIRFQEQQLEQGFKNSKGIST